MRQMCLIGLAIDPRNGQQILLLTDVERRRAIPMTVSLSQANNINMALSGIKTITPLMHELLLNVVSTSGQAIECVQIDLGGDGSLFATLKLKLIGSLSHNNYLSLIANPVDAVVLAIRAGVPIYASEQVMATSVSADVSKDEQERQKFQQFVETLKASDFKSEGLSNHP
jgi:hypothetical protein